jgi:hypothetical protein
MAAHLYYKVDPGLSIFVEPEDLSTETLATCLRLFVLETQLRQSPAEGATNDATINGITFNLSSWPDTKLLEWQLAIMTELSERTKSDFKSSKSALDAIDGKWWSEMTPSERIKWVQDYVEGTLDKWKVPDKVPSTTIAPLLPPIPTISRDPLDPNNYPPSNIPPRYSSLNTSAHRYIPPLDRYRR